MHFEKIISWRGSERVFKNNGAERQASFSITGKTYGETYFVLKLKVKLTAS
jgi:hypothetical protein